MFQEINLRDKELRQDYVDHWKDDEFSQAYDILSESQLEDKGVVASVFNDITDAITDLEEQDDPTFKKDKIELANTPPVGLTVGEVYFQIK